MSFIIDGTNGLTFNDATTQVSTATNASNISSGTLGKPRLPTGSVLQVVGSTYNTTVTTSGTSLITTGLTATITPTSASSKIYVMLVNPMRRNAVSSYTYGMQVAIFRNGSNIVTGMSNMGYSDPVGNMAESWLIPYNYLDSPATTSATTYTMYFGMTSTGYSGSSCVDSNTATITLMEIAA